MELRLASQSAAARSPEQEGCAPDLRWALAPADEMRDLLEAGRLREVIERLQARPTSELSNCPELAVILATALADIGQPDEALRWAEVAQGAARDGGDWRTLARACVTRGKIALMLGDVGQARSAFTEGSALASADADSWQFAECASGLGHVALLQGQDWAAGAAFMAAAVAWEASGSRTGAAEAYDQLSISYRNRAMLAAALWAADRAVDAALGTDDRDLLGRVLAGRAEARAAAGDSATGRREAERAAAVHRESGNAAGETEALRIVAVARAALGERGEAEALLREVVERARAQRHPALLHRAERDLARICRTAPS